LYQIHSLEGIPIDEGSIPGTFAESHGALVQGCEEEAVRNVFAQKAVEWRTVP